MHLSPLRLRLLVASLLIVSVLGALDHTIVSTSLATIAGSLGALEHMSWIVVAYTLASTVLQPVVGRLADHVGPRAVFLSAVAAFLLASLVCGLAPTMPALIAARVVQGISAGAVQLMSQTIIALVTTPRERPKLTAIIGAAFPVAILVGPVLGGLIVDLLSWQWVFWVNLPFGLVALGIAAIAIPKLERMPSRGFDPLGSLTLTAGLVALVLGVTWIGEQALLAQAVAALILGAVGLVAFGLIELRVPSPIVPLRLLADRTIAAGLALTAIIGIGLFSVTAYLPTYFQMAYRVSATASGLVPIATVFGMLASNLVTGWLVSRSGHYRAYCIVGTALGALGLGVMAALPHDLPLWAPMVVMAVVGIGTGAFMNLIIAVVQSAVPRAETSGITATINLVRQIGATVATAVIGGALASGVAARLPSTIDSSALTPQHVQGAGEATQALVAASYSGAMVPIFTALAIVYGVGIVAALLLPARRLRDDTGPLTVATPSPSNA
ncbi:MFS transporter [Agrococcus sp. DT81.2]|uniref:MFS transporter n=1 Tax=Agrococcus sp. DT81.2 TaxID=3393414 RepID=UPI003CE5C3A6